MSGGPATAVDTRLQTEEARFWVKVEKTDECWTWTGALDPRGYGRFRTADRRTVFAHRWSFLSVHDDIPERHDLDHLCRNPSCVRPDHLEAVTHRENVLRGDSSVRRTGVCKAGLHPMIGHNAMTAPSRQGRVTCRACFNARRRVRVTA